MTDSQVFVFEGFEVKLTGRTAERKLRTKVDTLNEITPADIENGSWKKWVHLKELYEIK